MLRTYLYVQDDLDRQISRIAKIQKKKKAEIIRTALENGVRMINQQSNASARALLRLAEIGEKIQAKGPKDLSANLDSYLWGISKD